MRLFKDYFGGYVNAYQLSSLGAGVIDRLTIKKEAREISIALTLPELVPYSEIVTAENDIKRVMQLKKVIIKPRYMSDLFELQYFFSIIDYVKRRNPAANGFFDDADVSLEADILKISLKKGGLELLLTQGVDKDIENTFLDMFGMSVKVEMIETESYDVEKAAKAAAAEKKAKEEEVKKEEIKNVRHTLLW